MSSDKEEYDASFVSFGRATQPLITENFGYAVWQRAENKDLRAPTETIARSVHKVLSDTFLCHFLSFLSLFLFLSLLLFKTGTVCRRLRSGSNP